MKLKKVMIAFFMLSSFILSGGLFLPAYAGFATDTIDSDKKQKILSSMQISLLTVEPENVTSKQPILCFDVNDKEMIALGFKTSSGYKYVCVYNQSGNFVYGYSFITDGAFGVELEGENIRIYCVRSDLAVLLDKEGNCIEIKTILNTIENNSYWRNNIRSNKRVYDTYEYELKNDMGLFDFFVPHYSQLIKRDNSGAETILYDVNNQYMLKIILSTAGIVLLVVFVIYLIIKEAKKLNKFCLNGVVMTQSGPEGRLDFFYDDVGDLLGFTHNGSPYYYVRNGQNDIIGILNSADKYIR